MTQTNTASHAHPSPALELGSDRRAAGFDAGLLTVPPALLATVGEQIASLTLRLQQEPALTAPSRAAAAELEQLGMELQELVHALGVVSRGTAEGLDLQQAARAAVQLWQGSLRQHGLTLQLGAGDAVPVQMDPVLLQHALDLLIGHGIACGADFYLAALPSTAVTPAGLRLSGLGTAADIDELHWQLLRLLVRASGWRLTRHAPPGAPAQAPLSQADLVFGSAHSPAFGDEGLPRMHVEQGTRVLVLDPNEISRVQCARLLAQASIPCDCMASVGQAEDALRHGSVGWTAVVSGFALEDMAMQRLATALQERLGSLRWIELVDDSHEFALGTPDGNRPSRIARADLAHTLLASLAT